uniref:Uncharacterized protein n=1 Tax=Rousettus aegyptiacus TaxID=9407 RepID=A0A7J8F0K2_ROUAE|nr:hypothetical protein HJG63_012418 [Rousettus aegyptiacus]
MNKPARNRLKAEQGPGDASSLIILEGASEPWRWWPAPWCGNDRDDQPRPDRESPVQRTRGRAVRKTEWPRHPPNEQTHTHRSERKSTLFEITRKALGEAARGSAFEIGAQDPSLRGTELVCLTNATGEGRRAGRGGGGGARQAGLGQRGSEGQLGGGQVPHRSERKEGDRGSAQGAAAGHFSSVGVRFVPGGHCGLERGRAQESQSCRPLGRVLAPPSPWESQRLGGHAPSAWR